MAGYELPGAGRLSLIRIALLVGVLVFGGVLYYLRQDPSRPAPSAEMVSTLRLAGTIIWATAVVGVLALSAMAKRQRDPSALVSFSIAGWALGEMTALYGGVVYLLTGNPRWYLYGVACLLLTFVAFPVRTRG